MATNEMDTMADTSCAGKNWVMIEDTGFVCDVYPFKEGYEAIKNVPIATCATLVEGETGTDFILIGHEMLYFGPDMSRSLLNQNQIRDHIRHDDGRVQDDYTRIDEEFGIRTRDIFIPFQMRGAAVFFESRTPSPSELENLPHVVITSPDKWDPIRRPLRVATTTRQSYARSDHVYGTPDTLIPNEHELRQRIINSVRIREWYDVPHEPKAYTPPAPKVSAPPVSLASMAAVPLPPEPMGICAPHRPNPFSALLPRAPRDQIAHPRIV
jgi:hypothetical protein